MIQCLRSLKKNQNQQRQTIHFWHFSFTHTWLKRKNLTRDLGAVSCCLGFIKKKIKKKILQSLWEFFLWIFLLQNCSSITRIWFSPQTNEIQMTAIQMVTTWGFKTRENGVFFLTWLIYSSDFSFSRSSCQISPGILKTQPHHTVAVDLLAARLWWESSSPPHLVLYWIEIW